MTDAESLQQPYKPRSRWQYRCIVASIALLYLLLVGAAVWMLISLPFYEVKREPTPHELQPTAAALRTIQKTKVFYLTPKSDEVKNKTMAWKSSVAGTYNDTQQAFIVPRNGSYLLGVDLVLRCESERGCPSGSLKLTVTSSKRHTKSCRVKLEKEPPSCIHMLDLPADSRLLVSMFVEVQEGAEKETWKLKTWELDASRSQWWIFILDE